MPNPWDNDPIVSPARPSGGIYALPRDPAKDRAEARAERADARAAAADARAQADFDSKNTMVPPPGDTSKTGDEYLATIPTSLAGQVKALSEGRRAFPTGSALRSPSVQELIAAATQYDPTLDAANAATRVATRKKFTSGTTRDNITAINTALGHLGTLWQDAQKLNNFGSPLVNAPINAFEKTALGDERYTNFNLTRHAVVDELEKAFRGAGGTQAGIDEWKQGINNSQSPKQLRGAVSKAVTLLDSRLQALGDAYSTGMGRSSDPMEFLNPHAKAVFNALGPGGDGNVPDLPKDFGGAPPILGGTPPASPGGGVITGSNPIEGPQTDNQGVATGGSRTEIFHSPAHEKLASMLASGSPSANIRAFAKANDIPGGQVEAVLAWRAMNPHYKGGYNVHGEKVVPTTAFNQWAADPRRAGALAAVDAGTAGLTDEVTGAVNALRTGQPLSTAIDAADYAKQAEFAANPRASLAGSVVGGAASMALGGLGLNAGLRAGAKGGVGRNLLAWAARNPMKATALGDTGYMASYGAGENNDNRALGAGVGLITGPLGSFAGQGASKVIGAGLRGVTDPAVQRLQAAGIPLTVGEVLGGGWKKAQDAMTSIPIVGSMVAKRYGEGREAMNKAAFNAAGDIIDTPINQVGQPGIEALNTAKSQAYSNALDPIDLNLNTPSFTDPMRGVLEGASAIPPGELPAGYAANTIKRFVGNNISPEGTMTGPDFQKAYRGLAQTANRAAPKVEGHDISQSLGQAKDILTSELQGQNPKAYTDFAKANSANRHLNILADAVNAAKNQIGEGGQPLFTPAQLGRAATQNAKTYGGKIAAASGDRPFNVLAKDAQQVMSSKLPESGTAPRALIAHALLAAGGGGLGYDAGGTEGAAAGAAVPLGLLTALGTRGGQKALTTLLLNRVRPFRVAGQSKALSGPLGGDILASFGIPLATGQ